MHNRRSYALKFAVFKNAKQLVLTDQRHVADFVEW